LESDYIIEKFIQYAKILRGYKTLDDIRYRIITITVVLFIYLLANYPVPTIVCAIIISFAYFILQNVGNNSSVRNKNTIASKNYGIHSMEEEINRREALRTASLYLAPYRDIWSGQKLSNKYCSLHLGPNGYSIIGKDLTIPNRQFRITKSEIYSRDELWNMFLISFGMYTSYDKLLELCQTFKCIYKETFDQNRNADNLVNTAYPTQSYSKQQISILDIPEIKKEKLDVNNASEAELTALPGVSIITAKKLIKKREELNGFKNIEDVILFLKLKPHMENQVRELICVKKMKGSDKIKRYNERNIDL